MRSTYQAHPDRDQTVPPNPNHDPPGTDKSHPTLPTPTPTNPEARTHHLDNDNSGPQTRSDLHRSQPRPRAPRHPQHPNPHLRAHLPKTLQAQPARDNRTPRSSANATRTHHSNDYATPPPSTSQNPTHSTHAQHSHSPANHAPAQQQPHYAPHPTQPLHAHLPTNPPNAARANLGRRRADAPARQPPHATPPATNRRQPGFATRRYLAP